MSGTSTAARVIEIVSYRDEWQPEFERLNRAWVEQYFTIEAADLAEMQDPRTTFLAQGGEIFFVLEDETIVGTCAIAPEPGHPEEFHLSKMAVAESARGRGYGDRLMRAALEFARAAGAQSVTLSSNTVLAPAIRLYEKHGFREEPLDPTEQYTRANIKMRREFTILESKTDL